MKSFHEFYADEAMSMQTRMKMKRAAKKNKGKMKIARMKAAKKKANPEKLKQRAMKQARNILIKQLMKGKGKDELSFGQRQGLEKKLDAKKGKIKQLAKKLLPSIKKKESEKFAKKAKGGEE